MHICIVFRLQMSNQNHQPVNHTHLKWLRLPTLQNILWENSTFCLLMDDVSRTDMIVAHTALINSFGPSKLHSSVTVRKQSKKLFYGISYSKVFSCTIVTLHIILTPWRQQTDPCYWNWPLKTMKFASNFLKQEKASIKLYRSKLCRGKKGKEKAKMKPQSVE